MTAGTRSSDASLKTIVSSINVPYPNGPSVWRVCDGSTGVVVVVVVVVVAASVVCVSFVSSACIVWGSHPGAAIRVLTAASVLSTAPTSFTIPVSSPIIGAVGIPEVSSDNGGKPVFTSGSGSGAVVISLHISAGVIADVLGLRLEL